MDSNDRIVINDQDNLANLDRLEKLITDMAESTTRDLEKKLALISGIALGLIDRCRYLEKSKN